MKILVAIANYGFKNRAFAEALIENFRGFESEVDVVVLSESAKDFGDDVEVRVGLPSANPWSLPFAHRPLFAERKTDYDLFIYTEDDTEILERHVRSFLEVTHLLPEDMLAGFLRYESGPDGQSYYSTVHAHYHWDVDMVFRIGDRVFSRYTNDHSACFLLTRDQLARCIDSGGFLVEPHEGAYDMLCSAATDPYTQCGFTKVLCISHIADFSLHHMPDVYLGRIGVEKPEIDRQIDKLIQIEGSDEPRGPIVDPRATLDGFVLDKRYFDERQPEVLALVPRDAGRVLSVGCGRGLTEGELVERGHEVVAVPLDCVIGESARMRGVKTTVPDLHLAARSLTGEQFDVLWFNAVLNYVVDPVPILRAYRGLLAQDGIVVVSFDNHRHVSMLKRRLEEQGIFGLFSQSPPFEVAGTHRTDARLVRSWLRRAGFAPTSTHHEVMPRHRRISRFARGLGDAFLGSRGAVAASARSWRPSMRQFWHR